MVVTKLQRSTTLVCCTILAISLHLLFQLAMLSVKSSTSYSIGVAIAISFAWIKVYKLITGETKINPFINTGITLGSPFVAMMLRDRALRNGDWVIG
jgi:hypothetical protein